MKQIKDNWMIIILCAFAFYIMYVSDNRAIQAERELKAIKDSLDFPSTHNDTLDNEIK